MLTALTQPSPADLLAEIRRCRAMTAHPFGVNLTTLPAIKPPPYADYVEAIIEGGVRIVETAGNTPEALLERLKSAGTIILHKCTSVRHAQAAQRRGVDAVSIDGFECAGHPGENDIPNLVLIPATVRALDIPVIASGGIADGSGMAAALVLGAEGVNMGTRFMLTKESGIHPDIKAALAMASERDTRLIFRSLGNTSRVFRNKVSEQVVAMERRPGGCSFEEIRDLVSGARGRAALDTGDVHGGVITAGLVIGLIDDIPGCDSLLQTMVTDCRAALQRASAMAA